MRGMDGLGARFLPGGTEIGTAGWPQMCVRERIFESIMDGNGMMNRVFGDRARRAEGALRTISPENAQEMAGWAYENYSLMDCPVPGCSDSVREMARERLESGGTVAADYHPSSLLRVSEIRRDEYARTLLRQLLWDIRKGGGASPKLQRALVFWKYGNAHPE